METGKDRIEELRTFYGKKPPQLRVEADQQPWIESTVAVWEMRLNHCRTVEPDDFFLIPKYQYRMSLKEINGFVSFVSSSSCICKRFFDEKCTPGEAVNLSDDDLFVTVKYYKNICERTHKLMDIIKRIKVFVPNEADLQEEEEIKAKSGKRLQKVLCILQRIHEDFENICLSTAELDEFLDDIIMQRLHEVGEIQERLSFELSKCRKSACESIRREELWARLYDEDERSLRSYGCFNNDFMNVTNFMTQYMEGEIRDIFLKATTSDRLLRIIDNPYREHIQRCINYENFGAFMNAVARHNAIVCGMHPELTSNIGADAAGDLPSVLTTPKAKALWAKAQEAGWVDAQRQPTVSLPKAAILASVIGDELDLDPQWPPFEKLWGKERMATQFSKAQKCNYYAPTNKKMKEALKADPEKPVANR